MKNLEKNYVKARTAMIMGNPWFGQLSLRLQLVEDNSIEATHCDGSRMRINPEYFDSLTPQRRQGVVATAVAKCALGHHTRAGSRLGKQWDQASDMAVHSILKQSGIALADSHPEAPANMADSAVDEIYKWILESEIEDQDGPEGQGPGGDGDGDDPQEGDEQQPDGDDGGQGRGGGGVSLDEPKDDDGEALSESDKAQGEQDWKLAATQAAKAAAASGKAPGWLESFITEINRPKLDWKMLLRDFVEARVTDEYVWHRPNKSFIHQGLYLPSVHGEEMPPIAVVFDTSGSVADSEYKQFVSELNSILEDCGVTEAHIFWVDTRLARQEEVTEDDLPISTRFFRRSGYGGTCFRPAFEAIEEQDLDIACLIYLTDGECTTFADEPDFDVLWVITKSETSYEQMCSGWDVKVPYGNVAFMV